MLDGLCQAGFLFDAASADPPFALGLLWIIPMQPLGGLRQPFLGYCLCQSFSHYIREPLNAPRTLKMLRCRCPYLSQQR
jgi:hypothetical protein